MMLYGGLWPGERLSKLAAMSDIPMRVYGRRARLALVVPYPPSLNAEETVFFAENGVAVARPPKRRQIAV